MSERIGVIGARSLVGRSVCTALATTRDVIAFARQSSPQDVGARVEWRVLPAPEKATSPELANPTGETIADWIFVAHISLVPDYFEMMKAFGVKRLVMLSSTSRFTKTESAESADRELARTLVEAEDRVAVWSEANGVVWTVLRPTLTYGGGRDQNIAAMAGFAQRFHFFPLLGRANGLRQPVHVEDVARACIDAMSSVGAKNRAYNISGAEILTYREMATRVFKALDKTPRLVPIPLGAIKAALSVVRLVPKFQHWSPGMAERMNLDMVFDHADAKRDFDFNPRGFVLTASDVRRPE